ncbi:hypothetical protein V1512DRAFT_262517 [Lipomyces arxii]|uniref:uncharacterized protein n=1 Tax=Lipomyces arxii TaxID=56418 RepID=UPI0034CF8C51
MDRRRVWVRRPHGAATTVFVTATDIVDDLKSAILRKYSTSLGRTHDSPDIVVRMPGLHQQVSPHGTGTNTPHHGRHRKRRGEAVRKELASALEPNASPQAAEDDERILLPDEVVCTVLDRVFPAGMGMQDALIVEVPEDDMEVQARQLNTNGLLTPQEGYFSSEDDHNSTRSVTPVPAYGQSSQSLPEAAQYHHHPNRFIDDTEQQRAASADPYSTHSHGHGHRRKQQASNAPGQRPAPAGSTASLPTITQSISSSSSSSSSPSSTLAPAQQITHSSNFRPQPQPIQRTDGFPHSHHSHDSHGSDTHSHHSSVRSVHDETGSVRARSPHRTGLHHSHSGAATPTQQAVQSHANVKSPLQNVTRYDDELGPKAENLELTASNDSGLSDSSDKTDRTDTTVTPATVNHQIQEKARRDKQIRPTTGSPLLFDGVMPPVKVLIVEDNIINQKILEAFMRKRQIRSGVAKNGKEAIEKWREGGYHLVLMDIQLPVLSGIEATKEIRRLERRNRIGVFVDDDAGSIKDEDVLLPHRFKSPVIIVALTASSLDSDRREALAAGCNDFLTKPVNLVWLERKITEWGCMQALIDFEGWRQWSRKPSYSRPPTVKS